MHNREASRKWQPGGQVARKVQAAEPVVMVAKVVVVVVEVVVTLVRLVKVVVVVIKVVVLVVRVVRVVRVVVDMREGEWQAIVTRRGG